MSVTGIIAEFNPLHKGHEYLIKQAKQYGPVVCVISSNFVQRGDTAIAEKRMRAKAALDCGADLILELPVPWSMSTAQNFALGGVCALNYIGCDKIMFGSECGDIKKLKTASEILDTPEFSQKLASYLKSGITFAAARENAAIDCGADNVFAYPNNNLAIEYITAARRLNANLEFETVKRIGAEHDSLLEDTFVSASLLRGKLLSGDFAFCEKHMPANAFKSIDKNSLSDINTLETAILSVLRTRTLDELSRLPDISEGVENKLFSAIRLATSLEELYNKMKVKRYTLARIRRLVLSAFIGIDNSFFMKPLPYVRILGFNKNGQNLLKSVAKSCPVPVISRVSTISDLSQDSRKLFEIECRATDLYCLSLNKPLECGLEYTAKILKME